MIARRLHAWTSLFAALALDACGSSGSSSVHTCDPLTAATAPITLGTLVGAGRGADGTVYVIDRSAGDAPDLRAYVSSGTTLQREAVGGSGEGSDFVELSAGTDAAPLQVRIELTTGVPVRMAVYRGALDPTTKSFDPGTQGEVLTLLARPDLSAFKVANIPARTVVEFDETTSDGHRLVMMHPAPEYTYESYRLFYGTPASMVERALTSVGRGKSNDAPLDVQFDLDGVQATGQLYEPQILAPPRGHSNLAIPGQASIDLTDSPAPTGAGLSYVCR